MTAPRVLGEAILGSSIEFADTFLLQLKGPPLLIAITLEIPFWAHFLSSDKLELRIIFYLRLSSFVLFENRSFQSRRWRSLVVHSTERQRRRRHPRQRNCSHFERRRRFRQIGAHQRCSQVCAHGHNFPIFLFSSFFSPWQTKHETCNATAPFARSSTYTAPKHNFHHSLTSICVRWHEILILIPHIDCRQHDQYLNGWRSSRKQCFPLRVRSRASASFGAAPCFCSHIFWAERFRLLSKQNRRKHWRQLGIV